MRSKPGSKEEAPVGKRIAEPATGRAAAIEVVYDAYVEQIYRFVYFRVGNREDAQDITSEVFIKAANSLDVTRETHIQLAWLYQVARTTIADHWSDYYRGVTTSLNGTKDESSLLQAGLPQPTFADA